MSGDVDADIAPFNPRKPRPIAFDFGKAGERFPEKPDIHETEDQLLLEIQYPDKKVRNAVTMSVGQARFSEKLPEDPFYQDQPLNEFSNDVQAALKAIKPKVPGVSLGKGPAKDNGDLKEVMRQQDLKDQKLKAAKEQSKEKYRVQNNFTPAKKKALKKKSVFKSADDEVNQYMKDLGLL